MFDDALSQPRWAPFIWFDTGLILLSFALLTFGDSPTVRAVVTKM